MSTTRSTRTKAGPRPVESCVLEVLHVPRPNAREALISVLLDVLAPSSNDLDQNEVADAS